MKFSALLAALVFTGFSAALAASPDPLTFTIDRGEATEVAVAVRSEGPIRLRFTLSDQKRSDFATFTQRNLEKQVNIVVNGVLLGQPVVKARISAGTIDLYAPSIDAGLSVIKAIMAKK